MTKTPIASLWTAAGDAEPAYRSSGPPTGDRSVDVVVVGGGIAGLSTALRLHEDGAEVAVIERHRVGAGVTGGSTAKVTALHGLLHADLRRLHGAEAARLYATANAAAVDRLAAVVDRYGIDCALTRADAVDYATTSAGLASLQDELDAAREAGLPVAGGQDAPGELPFPVRGVVSLPDQAHIHPRRYCEGLASALGAGAVHEGTAAVAVDEDEGGCHVRTSAGPTVHAEQAVVATHGPIVDPRYLAVRCRPSRSYVVALEATGAVPQAMYLSVDEPTRSLRTATVDGTPYLLVGGEGHPVADEADALEHLEALESWARSHFPVGAARHRWAAHDQVPSDRLPFAGRLVPGSRRWVATGFQKWGFTTSTVAADVIADGVAGRPNPVAALLDPSRIRSTATPDLARAIGRVACRFVGDEVAARIGRRGQDPSSVPAGGGVVLGTAAGPTAVHRDAEGELHAVSARCTHEGCLVRFNRAQQSWDCPCHGSRFAPDGTVLSGPAVQDLRRVDLPATDLPSA